MGFLSGSKKYTTANTTNVTTTTSTRIRDIGVTGAHGIELERIMQQGTTDRALISAGVMDRMLTKVGGAYEKLVGGAGDYSNDLVDTAERQAVAIREAAAPSVTLMKKALPYAAAAFVAVVFLMKRGH